MQNIRRIAGCMLSICTLACAGAGTGIDMLAAPMTGKLESTVPPEPSESVVEVVIKDSEKGSPPASASQRQDASQGPAEAILGARQPRIPSGNGRMTQNPSELGWGKMDTHRRKDIAAEQRQFTSNKGYKNDGRATEAWPSRQQERCYVINTDMIPVSEVGRVIDQFSSHSSSVRFVYKKNILGFAFCTSNSGIIDSIREKYTLVNVEEDKTFRIGSVENDARLRQNIRAATNAGSFEGDLDFIGRGRSKSGVYLEGTVKIGTNGMIQSPVPTHFYRIMNMGNAFFNNYLLDNAIFRMLGISSLIRYFYSHEYFYTGRNVKVTIIDTPRCNEHRQISSSLITGFENSLAKNASLRVIEALSCDGTIKLSRLLDTLEKIPRTDILVLPFSGPHSEVLNTSLKRVALGTIIVAASGNDSENSCNHSPSGHHMIGVGSVDKHGYVSTFSNRGSCTNLYALGEDVLGRSGTSYSASLVASAAAVFIEKHPGASYEAVLEHLMDNTMKNEYNLAILKIPRVDPRTETRMEQPYHTWKSVTVYCAILVIAVVAILYSLLRRYRANDTNEQYTMSSLR